MENIKILFLASRMMDLVLSKNLIHLRQIVVMDGRGFLSMHLTSIMMGIMI